MIGTYVGIWGGDIGDLWVAIQTTAADRKRAKAILRREKMKPKTTPSCNPLLDFSDIIKALDKLADMVHANAKKKGFHIKESEHEFMHNQWLNVICEVAELQESYRDGTLRKPCDKAARMFALGLPPLTSIEEEYADIIIRDLDQCRRLKVDIARAIIVKHLFNLSRPALHGREKG